MNFCKICVTPNTRPRVVFDKTGICNACINAEKKSKLINWENRENEFLDLVKKIKHEENNDNPYNCLVPWSGGKDSTYVALRLKFEFGLKPLLVTFSPLIPNFVGQFNRQILIKKGFDALYFSPNQKVGQTLAKRFFIERGNPKVAWDAGINSVPVNTALNYNISNIFYAEHGESEYGGLVLDKESEKTRNSQEVIEHIIGDYPENWISDELSLSDIKPYMYPSQETIDKNNIKSHYFSYYFKWSINENYNYVKKKLPDFMENEMGRTEGTFTNFDSLDDKIDDIYYYMQYVKFGFGRATRDASRFIANGELSREEAIDLVKKYDGEFPSRNLDEVLKYLNISKFEFEEIVNKHRNEEIWTKDNNYWKLKYKVNHV
jgi:N-acetyl sugar amidotransferase